MPHQVHILNGDCLRERFPSDLAGQIIVMRECLVDGPVAANTLEDLYQIRAKFLIEEYGLSISQEYFDHTISEIDKIKNITGDSEVYLWFEDDLFCQVNFWFVAFLILKNDRNYKIYLVRPETHTQFGFGGLDEDELMEIYEKRMLIVNLESIAKLWISYQQDDLDQLVKLASQFKITMPFILDVVQAHIERKPTKDDPGRPIQAILDIMTELDTKEFAPLFAEFTKREKIYGFGDLQVKRLFDLI
jgi:hypothetical protein